MSAARTSSARPKLRVVVMDGTALRAVSSAAASSPTAPEVHVLTVASFAVFARAFARAAFRVNDGAALYNCISRGRAVARPSTDYW